MINGISIANNDYKQNYSNKTSNTFTASNYGNFSGDIIKDNVCFGANKKSNSSENAENKKSKGLVWGILLSGAALGVAIGCIIRGKVEPTVQFKQLQEHIDFKETKTMEEAKAFAKNNFGVELEVGDNLLLANMINDVCTQLSNAFGGKVGIPEKFVCRKKPWIKLDTTNYNVKKNVVEIYDNFGDEAVHVKNRGTVKYNYFNTMKDKPYGNEEYFYDIFLHLKEKLFKNLALSMHYADDKTLYKSDGIFTKRGSDFALDFDKDMVKAVCAHYKVWNSDVPPTPNQYLSAVFAKKMMGVDIPVYLDELYKKYGGIDVPV